jgi:hypothetical protein
MSISIDYEFTFGGVPCLVTTTTGARPTAWMFVIVAEGHTLRPLVDDAGQRIEFVCATSGEALDGALSYLEHRFGVRGPARHWAHTRSPGQIWTVLRDSPVRPDHSSESLVVP